MIKLSVLVVMALGVFSIRADSGELEADEIMRIAQLINTFKAYGNAVVNSSDHSVFAKQKEIRQEPLEAQEGQIEIAHMEEKNVELLDKKKKNFDVIIEKEFPDWKLLLNKLPEFKALIKKLEAVTEDTLRNGLLEYIRSISTDPNEFVSFIAKFLLHAAEIMPSDFFTTIKTNAVNLKEESDVEALLSMSEVVYRVEAHKDQMIKFIEDNIEPEYKSQMDIETLKSSQFVDAVTSILLNSIKVEASSEDVYDKELSNFLEEKDIQYLYSVVGAFKTVKGNDDAKIALLNILILSPYVSLDLSKVLELSGKGMVYKFIFTTLAERGVNCLDKCREAVLGILSSTFDTKSGKNMLQTLGPHKKNLFGVDVECKDYKQFLNELYNLNMSELLAQAVEKDINANPNKHSAQEINDNPELEYLCDNQ